MGKVAEIIVPPPEPFVEGEEGAEAKGAGYRFIAPRTATEPLVFQSAEGSAFLWTPTELVYGDADGHLDYIAGSAPAAFTVRGRSVHYPRTFPASEEVHVVLPEGRKYWLYLYEPPRLPGAHLSGDVWFGVSGMVGGIPLPPGRHREMEAFGFRFQPVYAEDTMGARVEGWYEIVNTDEGQQLFICVPAKWLLAPERVYPVKLDPTITLSDTNRAFYPPSGNCVVTLSDGRKIALLAVTMNKKQFFISSDNGETWAPLLDYPRSVNMNVYTEHATCLAVNDLDQVFIRSNKYLDMLTIDANGTPTLTQLADDLPVAERRLFVWRDDNRTILVALKGDGTYLQLNVYAVEADGTLTSIQSTTPFSVATDGEVGAMHSDRSIWVAGRSGSSTYRTRVQKMVWDGSKYIRSGDMETAFESSSTSSIGIAVDAKGRPLVVVSTATFSRQVMRRSLTGEWENLGFPASHSYAEAIFCDGNDIYVVYIGYSDQYIYLSKWDEAAKTWNTAPIYEGQVETAASVSVEKRDGNQANSVVILYKVGNEVRSYTHTFNQPPKQPTHLDRQPFDATEDAVFRWQYNDDPGDGQSAYHLQIRLAGADTDLVDTGEVQSPVSEYILPADTLTNGQSYQWRVRTADQSGEWSPWSDYAVFQTGPKPVATILSPTAGATVSTSEVTVEWSVPSQSRATVRLYDEAGQTVLQEHEVTTPSARQRTITGLENNRAYQVSVQPISSIGVTGDEVFSGPFSVQYTPPPKPTATAAGQAGFIRVTITNPAPAEGEPEVTHNDLYRREPGRGWVRIATGIEPDGTYDDYAVGSGVIYEYRARAVGANGTYTDSDPAQATVTFEEWRFSPVDGRPEIRFRFDSSVTWRPEEDVQVPRTMSRYRRAYRNPAYPRVATIQARFRDGEDGLTVREQRERLLQYIEQGVVGWLRGPHGDCWRGVLLEPEVLPSTHFARETVACVFRETREAP